MEVPFYYSFKEFKENYENDLQSWLSIYYEANEECFLKELKTLYGIYLDNNGDFREKYCYLECLNVEYSHYELHYFPDGLTYAKVNSKYIIEELSERLSCIKFCLRDCDKFLKNVKLCELLNDLKLLDEYTGEREESTNKYCLINDLVDTIGITVNKTGGDLVITEDIVSDLEEFYYFEYYESETILCFDEIKYTNFKLSIPKIYNFIQEKLNPKIETETTEPQPDEVEPITLPENIDKIQINGNYQLLAFLFNELIDKGYITAPTYLGKPSHKRTAEMLLKHFEFTNKTEQPSVDNLTNYIKNNTYSMQKQSLFKIPSIKKAND